MKNIDFYLIRAISNLHVGSGEGDFSVIDKQIQRDAVTGLPTIHASGIKGALREAMSQYAKQDTPWEKAVLDIFGALPREPEAAEDKAEEKPRRKIKQGLNNFFEGRLLSLPIRSSHDFFYRATCPLVLQEFIAQLDLFKQQPAYFDTLRTLAGEEVADGAPHYFGADHGKLILEDWKAKHNSLDLQNLADIWGKKIALLSNDDFRALAKSLPIIARNYLNDGISKNLWYEEVVPRESLFFTTISRHHERDDLNDFLNAQDNLVQLGANATVGYGLCTFKKLQS